MFGVWKRLHFLETELKVIAKSAHQAHGSINHDLWGIMIPVEGGGGWNGRGWGRGKRDEEVGQQLISLDLFAFYTCWTFFDSFISFASKLVESYSDEV